MSTATFQVNPNGAIPGPLSLAGVKEILVEYVPATGGVIVTPGQVDKDTTVRFRDPKGNKLKIIFLSPEGNETDTVLDSDTCTMIVGGIYHFLCFFTSPGDKYEQIVAKTGGVLEVYPPRP